MILFSIVSFICSHRRDRIKPTGYINTDLKESPVLMHPALADILVNNMLVNAIRHNNSQGVINIATRQGSVKITNSGDGSALDQNSIFNRFEKSNASEGTGLGLAIVKQICDTYQFKIEYSFQKGLHDFTIMYN